MAHVVSSLLRILRLKPNQSLSICGTRLPARLAPPREGKAKNEGSECSPRHSSHDRCKKDEKNEEPPAHHTTCQLDN
eukprot:6166574-Amphidinium_carterae.1